MVVLDSSGSDAGWVAPALPAAVPELRRRAVDFATAAGATEEINYAVALAVSETVTNAVVHAYAGGEPGQVGVRCRTDGERLIVEVVDDGAGIAVHEDSPGIGQGLALVGA